MAAEGLGIELKEGYTFHTKPSSDSVLGGTDLGTLRDEESLSDGVESERTEALTLWEEPWREEGCCARGEEPCKKNGAFLPPS